MVDASASPVATTPSRAPSLMAIGCGFFLLLVGIGFLVVVITVVSIVRRLEYDVGGLHFPWPWHHHERPEPWDPHHDRPEPWDPHDDRHHDHDDHHHRRRSERVEEFLDNYANNVGAVYIEAGRKKEKGEKVGHDFFDRLFLKAHERAASSIRKQIEDTGEGPNYTELGREFQGKEE